MTEQKRYPTANGGGWNFGANIYDGVEDGTTCAYKRIIDSGISILWLSGYSFAIPSGAILDNVFIDHKGWINTSVSSSQILFFAFRYDSQDCPDMDSDMGGGFCLNTAYKGEVDILPVLAATGRILTVNDLNTENFTTFLQFTGIVAITQTAYVDAAYIRVVYHVPPSLGGGASGNSAIAVFVGIQGYIHRRKKRRFIATLK